MLQIMALVNKVNNVILVAWIRDCRRLKEQPPEVWSVRTKYILCCSQGDRGSIDLNVGTPNSIIYHVISVSFYSDCFYINILADTRYERYELKFHPITWRPKELMCKRERTVSNHNRHLSRFQRIFIASVVAFPVPLVEGLQQIDLKALLWKTWD